MHNILKRPLIIVTISSSFLCVTNKITQNLSNSNIFMPKSRLRTPWTRTRDWTFWTFIQSVQTLYHYYWYWHRHFINTIDTDIMILIPILPVHHYFEGQLNNRASMSPDKLMVVWLQKGAKLCSDATKLECTQCAGRSPAQWVQLSFVESQHCLETNTKISRDRGTIQSNISTIITLHNHTLVNLG